MGVGLKIQIRDNANYMAIFICYVNECDYMRRQATGIKKSFLEIGAKYDFESKKLNKRIPLK